MPMLPEVPNSLGRRTRRWLKHGLKAVDRQLRATAPEDLYRGIRAMGVRPGDVMMVHSSFSQMHYFQGTALDAIQAMITVVGPDGTVVMPTFSFQGRSYDFLAKRPTFDQRHSPAYTGLLCELLRRRDDAVRSLHPSHSVAAVGRLAEDIAGGYERSVTPFDEQSPWNRMSELNAWIFNIGLTQRQLAITQYHYAEEALQALMPVSLYWPEPFEVTVRDAQGQERIVQAYAHHPHNRKDYRRIIEWHYHSGVLRYRRVGAIDIWACRAHDLLKATESLAHQGCTVFSETGWDVLGMG